MRENERERNLRGSELKGCVIVVHDADHFLATSSQSDLTSVVPFVQSVSQSVSLPASHQPSRSSLGGCRPTEHGNTITTPGTLCFTALPLRPASATPPPFLRVVMTPDCVTPVGDIGLNKQY